MIEQNPIAFLFPGQGSQFKGMGAELLGKSQIARDIFKKADEILPFSVTDLCLQDPNEELSGPNSKTSKIQPALFTLSVATSRHLDEAGVQAPVMVAGHSLGRFSAIEKSGSIDFETALGVVYGRGKIMEEEKEFLGVQSGIILGTSRAIIEAKLTELGEKASSVRVTIENAARQVMVCGVPAQVEVLFGSLIEEARKFWLYHDAPPSHHPFLVNAQNRLNMLLEQVRVAIGRSTIPVLDDITGELIQSDTDHINSLAYHLIRPLNWRLVAQKMKELGISQAIEVGPGNILKGITRQDDRNISVYTTSSWEEIEEVIRRFNINRPQNFATT